MKTNINYYVTPSRKINPKGDQIEDESQSGKQPMIASFSQNAHPVLSRAILFDQEINEMTSTALRAEVLAKVAEDQNAPIFLFLSSPGGGLYESLAIYDTLQLIPNEVVVICSGKVMSGGILILLACDIKLSTPNNTFMIHHGHTMLHGNVVQLKEQHKEIESLNDRMLDIIIKKTKISREQLKSWLVKDHYMSNTDALLHGLIDGEIESLDQLVVQQQPAPQIISEHVIGSSPSKKRIAKKAKKKSSKK